MTARWPCFLGDTFSERVCNMSVLRRRLIWNKKKWLEVLLEMNFKAFKLPRQFRNFYPVLLSVLCSQRGRGWGRWLTEEQVNDRAGSRAEVPASQHCCQLTGLCDRIALSLQLGQSKHGEVEGLGLMRTECPKLWLNLMEVLTHTVQKMQCCAS